MTATRAKTMGIAGLCAAGMWAALGLCNGLAYAQEPSQAQISAVRQSCRSDFMANCSSVTPGGKEALECLKRNLEKLSGACRGAVGAITPPPATAKPAAAAPAPTSSPPPAAAQDTPAAPAAESASTKPAGSTATRENQLKAVRQACTLNDFMSHCSWIQPSNPELLLCLQANASDLSPSCQAAVQGLPAAPAAADKPAPETEPKRAAKPLAPAPAAKKPAAAERERPPAPSAAPPAAAAAQPTEAQKAAIRSACRSDFMANCSGVQPGGTEAFQCLQRNSAKLSAGCQSAVAAIGGGARPASSAGAAPSASPAPTPPPTAVAPLGPIPPMRPREALAILGMCRAEQQSLCNGVPLGGGRILTCLAEHAPQLSLECYQALARASR